MSQQRPRASIIRLVLLVTTALVVAAAASIVVVCWPRLTTAYRPKAGILPRDLASAGFVIGYAFAAKNQMKLEELQNDALPPPMETAMAQTAYRGGNFLAGVDENGRLVVLMLLADTGVYVTKPELAMVEARTAELHLPLVELTRRDVFLSYGDPSWIDGSSHIYGFSKGNGALVEVSFYFPPKREPEDTDKPMAILWMLYEGDRAKEHNRFIREHDARIFEWPFP